MALFEGLRQLFGRNEELTDEQKKRRGRLNRVARGAGVVASPITAVSLIPKEKKDKALEFGKSVVQGTARNLALVASGLFAPLPEGQKPTRIINNNGKEVLVAQVGWAGIKLGRIDYYFDSKKRKKDSIASTVKISENTIGL